MTYLWLKYIHILSSTLLFGAGVGTATVMFYGHTTKNIQAMAVINQYVVLIDWLFTGTSGIIQPLSGFWMASIAGYSLTSPWLLWGILLYFFTAICWFIVVFLQIKIRNITMDAAKNNTPLPPEYTLYFRWWCTLGWPAFISLLIVFYLMVMKSW